MALNRNQVGIVFLGATLIAVFGVCGYLAIRVNTTITRGTLDVAPRIGDFTNNPRSVPCVFRETYSPHGATIHILGIVKDKEQLLQIFPLLQDQKSIPGADVLNERMSDLLLEEPSARTAFAPSDVYWPMPVLDDHSGSSYGQYACYSERTGYFYLEYGWSY